MTEPTFLELDSAAALLELPSPAVNALVESGYLAAARFDAAGPMFQLSELKAFLARNADNGAGAGLLEMALSVAARQSVDQVDHTDPEDRGRTEAHTELAPDELLDLLDERAEHMALRVFKIFSTVFPEAANWPIGKQGAFVQQAKGRFEAILAVTELGSSVDDALFDELRQIGASAARTGTALPHLLVLLRMSRDLMVQNAVELAEADGRNGGFALSLLLTRILPAMDRLSDALANGYWEVASGGS
jgi:hypothetical protein